MTTEASGSPGEGVGLGGVFVRDALRAGRGRRGGSAEAGGAQFGFGDGEDFVGDDGENVGAAGADAVNGLVVEAEGGDAEGVEDGGDDSRKIGRDFPVTGGGFVGPDLVLIRPFARM